MPETVSEEQLDRLTMLSLDVDDPRWMSQGGSHPLGLTRETTDRQALRVLLADHAAGKEREKRLREALEFYADKDTYGYRCELDGEQPHKPILADHGERARAALAETPDDPSFDLKSLPKKDMPGPVIKEELADDPDCPECGNKLREVVYIAGSSMLNEYQFKAIRAGDWYCEKCKGDRANTGYRYFWNRELEDDPGATRPDSNQAINQLFRRETNPSLATKEGKQQ